MSETSKSHTHRNLITALILVSILLFAQSAYLLYDNVFTSSTKVVQEQTIRAIFCPDGSEVDNFAIDPQESTLVNANGDVISGDESSKKVEWKVYKNCE